MTDDQINALIDNVAGSGSDVPLNESLTLKQENGAWKICDSGDAASRSVLGKRPERLFHFALIR